MIKCPKCGSTAQAKLISTNFEIDADDDAIVYVERRYQCDCGKVFSTSRTHFAEIEEEVDDFDW